MNRGARLDKLNWFFTLEKNQVDLYTAQSQAQSDSYLARVLARVAVIEQKHVDNMAAAIKELDAEPTTLGDVVAPILGKLGGRVTALGGPVLLLKADILLEQKAMQDYRDFIGRIDPDEVLYHTLWGNLVDEDLHTAWFANKVAELEAGEKS